MTVIQLRAIVFGIDNKNQSNFVVDDKESVLLMVFDMIIQQFDVERVKTVVFVSNSLELATCLCMHFV